MIKRIILTFLILSIILVESSIWPFPFTLLIVIILGLLMGETSFLWAFFAGITLDIFTLRLLGTDSMMFLLVCMIIGKYQKKVNVVNYFYMSIITGITLFAYGFYYYKNINITNVLSAILGSFVVLRIISSFFPEIVSSRKKITFK
jgi:rod shape-determining protein MreD